MYLCMLRCVVLQGGGGGGGVKRCTSKYVTVYLSPKMNLESLASLSSLQPEGKPIVLPSSGGPSAILMPVDSVRGDGEVEVIG